MTRVAPRGTRAAVEDAYELYEPLVKQVASSFAFHHGRDIEEVEGEANVLFLEALYTYIPEKGPLGTRLRSCIYNGLIDWARRESKVRNVNRLNQVHADDNVLYLQSSPTVEYFDKDGLRDSLGEDAQTVLALVLESPDELTDAIRLERRPGMASTRKCLRRFLRERLGWCAARISETFSEIREALS